VKYVELHHHTTFSYQDGHGTPEDHARETAALDQGTIVVTDHGNVSAHVGTEKAARKFGLKPIFGLEAYTALERDSRRKFHLTILAMNEVGYRNLNRLVTDSWESFYYWPTVTGDSLAKHNEGLIVLSGCSDSLLACSLLGGKSIAPEDASWERAMSTALKFKRLLGDRFYLECQQFPQLERTTVINPAYEEMGRKLGIPLVATGDVHTVAPGDSELRALLHAAGRGNNTIAQQLSSWEYDVPDFIPRSDREVFEAIRGTGLSLAGAREACRNTAEIASRCDVSLPKATRFRYPVADPVAELWRQLREGWAYRHNQGNWRMRNYKEDYLAQAKMEMERIVEKGFESYFLLVADLVRWAKDHGIAVGPGRGSSAASVVCYWLRITEPDPLQFPLTDFSRFVDPSREDLPDIDVDFDDARRHEVREYAVRKFGAENVGNIATFTKYKGKNSMQDVARVYQIPKSEIEIVGGMLIERSGGDSRADASLVDTFEMFPTAAAVLKRHPKLAQAIRLEGNYRGMSVHSAGLVISDSPINEVCAMYTREDKEGGQRLTAVSVDKYNAEYLGLMKIDVLGLTTMGTIANILDMIGMDLEELYALPYDDKETIDAFNRADVVGIFQFEGRATRLVCRDVAPDSFLDLIDINALSRPGPLFSGTTAEYTDVKHGRRKPTRVHPILDRIAQGTKGQIIYQEQILHALSQFGGLPVKRVHEIRRIISQKLGEAQFNTSAEDFAQNAMRLHGVTHETAMKVWERVVTSASYAFVYSHSLAYTIISYWMMWFKVHYPAAFYTALLQKVKEDKWPRLIKDAEKHDVTVYGVQPGRSGLDWTMLSPKEISAGWLSLKGVGPSKAKAIANYMETNTIRKADDLLAVKGIGPAILDKMRHQIEGDDPFGLRLVERALTTVRGDIKRGDIPLAPPTVRSDDILDLPGDTEVVWIGIARLKEFKDYVEDERARSGRDPEDIKREMWRPDLPTSCVLHCGDDGDEDVYLRFKRQTYPQFKAGIERIRVGQDVVYVRARKSQNNFGASLYVTDLVIIDPE
jgi:DNA polymerase-3 subunit alpha